MTLPETIEIGRIGAIERAVKAVDTLAEIGVSALVTGSLARGTYRPGSDIDLIVTACPRHLKYAIEGLVEDCLAGAPFDVIYLDEIPPQKHSLFVDGALRARDLRWPDDHLTSRESSLPARGERAPCPLVGAWSEAEAEGEGAISGLAPSAPPPHLRCSFASASRGPDKGSTALSPQAGRGSMRVDGDRSSGNRVRNPDAAAPPNRRDQFH